MRALILADIHANLEALNAVIEDAQSKGGFDSIWCLGDTVGYGPDPNHCIDLIRKYPLTIVAGNHDFAAVGKRTTADFNYAAKESAQWTNGQLASGATKFIEDLPLSAIEGTFTLVHGTLRDPLSEYLLDEDSAAAHLALMETSHCLVGHSHLPFICSENGGQGEPVEFLEFTEDQPFPLPENRCIFNPGGVGQPRDRDTRSSYAVFDSQKGEIVRQRVAYDIDATQEKMRKAKLPEYLIDRLSHGR